MADRPFRLVILERLSALLETTTGPTSSGGVYDLTGRVFRGRPQFGVDTPIPCLSILEAPTPDIGNFGGFKEAVASSWLLLLQGWDDDDPENPTDNAHWLNAAVIKTLSQVCATTPGRPRPSNNPNYLLGLEANGVSSFEIGLPVVRPPDGQVSSRAFFYLPVRVGLAQYVTEPYISV